jgi:hypothetical protein
MTVFEGKRKDYKYKTNKAIRAKIDKILEECSIMFANVNTKTPLDVGSREKAKKEEKKLLKKIKEHDEDFFNDRFKTLVV